MPKKTKKEKILAEYRKKLKLLQQQALSTLKIEEKKEVNLTLKSQIKISPKKIEKEFTSLPSYFLNDLKNSLLLSFLLIAFEIFLYFAKVIK